MTSSKAFLVFSLVAASFSGCVWAAPLVEEPPIFVSVPELPEAFYTENANFLTTPSDETSTTEPPTTTNANFLTTPRDETWCSEKPTETDCYKCPECYEHQWQCYHIPCDHITCVDPVGTPGECCYRCPTGPNCKINNQIVGRGQSVTLADGQVCYCLSEYSWELPDTVCVPPPPPQTTTKNDYPSMPETPTIPELPDAFYTEYANFMTPVRDETPTPPRDEPSTPEFLTSTEGCEQKPAETNCYKCPDCYEGHWMCYFIDCGPINCMDPVHNLGECCSWCPNGPNCKINDQIVGVGQSITLADGQVCYCLSENSWELPEVQCVPQPPTTTELPCENDTPSVPETPNKEYPIEPTPPEPTPPETTTTVTATTTTTRKAPITQTKKIPAPLKKKKPVPTIKKKLVLPARKHQQQQPRNL